MFIGNIFNFILIMQKKRKEKKEQVVFSAVELITVEVLWF